MATRAWRLFFFLVWALVGAVCVTSNARGRWLTTGPVLLPFCCAASSWRVALDGPRLWDENAEPWWFGVCARRSLASRRS